MSNKQPRLSNWMRTPIILHPLHFEDAVKECSTLCDFDHDRYRAASASDIW
jgi:hypothetical protein